MRHQFVNLHRKYYSPVSTFDNNTYFPVSIQCFDRYYWGNEPKEGEVNYFETEEAQINIINKKCKHFNAYWLDVCWFEGAFCTGVGNYRYGAGFPNKLKNLGDLAHSKGMQFILWFEPVRVMKDTELYNLYKDDTSKIIPCSDSDVFLANLGDPEVWQYQFEHISKIIEENDVDIYRQDFNIDPYDYLKSIEIDECTGVAQIRFVEGLYKLWDALLQRFPNLLIDNCASGERLLDVETAIRAISLWRSDMSCHPSPIETQNEILCLSRYIPYHQGGTFNHSPYFMRSAMTTGVACEFAFLSGFIDPEKEKAAMDIVCDESFMTSNVGHFGDVDTKIIERAMSDILRLREYWRGDFTALTPPSDKRDAIVAYTLRMPDEDRGVILVFRREFAPGSYVVKITDVNPDVQYMLKLSDEDYVETKMIVDGK